MLSAVTAVVVLLFLALATSPARAATELSSIFESVTRTAEALEVESAQPVDWFPVRGVVDFGETEARFGAWRGGRRHEGQDVFAKAGTPLKAVWTGKPVDSLIHDSDRKKWYGFTADQWFEIADPIVPTRWSSWSV